MLYRRQRIADDELDVEVDPDLVQHDAQVARLRVREHDELEARRRLVVVQLVVAGAVRDEPER